MNQQTKDKIQKIAEDKYPYIGVLLDKCEYEHEAYISRQAFIAGMETAINSPDEYIEGYVSKKDMFDFAFWYHNGLTNIERGEPEKDYEFYLQKTKPQQP